MSNRAFDILCAKMDLQDARKARGEWGRALVRTDLTAEEVKFLEGAFRKSQEWVKRAEAWLRRGAV